MRMGLFWFGRAISGNSQGVLDFSLNSQPAGDGLHVLSVGGEIDLFTAPEIRRAAVEAMERGARAIVVDLSETRFLDSTALGILVGIAKRLRARDGDLVIVNTDPVTASTFSITRVDDVVPVVDSRDAAFEIIRGGGHPLMH